MLTHVSMQPVPRNRDLEAIAGCVNGKTISRDCQDMRRAAEAYFYGILNSSHAMNIFITKSREYQMKLHFFLLFFFFSLA